MGKYQLPTSSRAFQDSTLGELQLEMLQDLVAKRRELRNLLGEKGYDADRVQDQINAINEVFGDREEAYDPLIDKWERELLEGHVPDLEER